MLWEAIRSYVQLATGVTEATTDKAKEVAQGLLSAVGITNSNEVAAQVSGMAEEVLSAARYQRDSFVNLVRSEVTTVIETSGVAKAADVDVLTSRLTQLAADVEALVSQLPGGSLTPAGRRTRRRAEAGEAPVEAFAIGAVGDEVEQGAPDGQAPARKRTAGTTSPAKKAASGKTGTRKTAAAKRTAAKKTTATKTAAKKTAASAPGESPRSRSAASKTASAASESPRRKTAASKTASADGSPRTRTSARKGAEKTTSSRKAASARKGTTARKSTEPAPQAPDTTGSEQAASAGSDNG